MKNFYTIRKTNTTNHRKTVKNVVASLLIGQVIIGCSIQPVQQLWNKNKSIDEQELKKKDEYYQSELQKEVVASVQTVDKSISNRRVLIERSPLPSKKIRFIEVSVEDEKTLVSLKATQKSFMSLLEGVSNQKSYSLIAAENVDLQKKITVDLQAMSFNQAIKQVAFLAGYVAIINDKDKTVTISETGTYTFRVPTNLLQKLTTTYNVGGNPITSSGGGGGGGGAQAASSVAPIKAQFNVEGGLQNGTASSLSTFLTRMAGKGTEIQVNGESGLILVKGNAHSLKRVQDFLSHYCDDAMKQVDIQAAIIEVTLSDDFQYGIDWDKVFSANSFSKFSSGGVTTSATNPSVFSVSSTRGSIKAVIQAIQRYSKTKIVSNPNTVLLNRSGATLFDGLQIPYVASVQSTVSTGGAGGANQVTVQTAFATDGVSLSVQAEILDNESVYITLIPVLSSIRSIDKLADAAGTAISAPTQGVKQSITSVLAQAGQTVILAGNRFTADSQRTSGIPFFSDIPFFGKLFGRVGNVKEEREYVILLRATPIPAPEYNPLIAESL